MAQFTDFELASIRSSINFQLRNYPGIRLNNPRGWSLRILQEPVGPALPPLPWTRPIRPQASSARTWQPSRAPFQHLVFVHDELDLRGKVD